MIPTLRSMTKLADTSSLSKITVTQTNLTAGVIKADQVVVPVLTNRCRKRKREEIGIPKVKKSSIPTIHSSTIDLPPAIRIKKETNAIKKEKSPHLDKFLNDLRIIGDIEAGNKMKKSLKSSHEHIGVNAPKCKKLVTTTAKELNENQILSLAEDLWQTKIFEAMICAAKLLELSKVRPSGALWKIILSFLEDIDNWAIEDQLAKAAQKCIVEDEKRLEDVEKWTEHTSFWIRRAALVYTLPFANKGGKPERMLKWANKYASEDEWFIQKAIGWWIRVLGTHNPQRAYHFLNENWTQLHKVAKKEGTRKLGVEWVQKLPPKHG